MFDPQYHPFAYREFHSFWQWLKRLSKAGRIIMLDSVYDELTRSLTVMAPRRWISQEVGSAAHSFRKPTKPAQSVQLM